MFQSISVYIVFKLIFSLLAFQPDVQSSAGDNIELLYSGLPPWGDSYYTAKISCGDIDGYDGEELVITDDYNTFQVLRWDPITRTFYQKWLNDPVFETSRINKIFIIPKSNRDDSRIIFVDSINNLKVFVWLNYLAKEETAIRITNKPTFQSWLNFGVGKFSNTRKGWEVVSMASKSIDLPGYSFNFQILRTGHINNGYHPSTTYFLPFVHKQPKLFFIKDFNNRAEGLVIASYNEGKQPSIKLTYITPDFNRCTFYTLHTTSREKIGWIGRLYAKSPVFLTALLKNEKTGDKLRLYKLDKDIKHIRDINIPPNVSSWEFADIDNDKFRELILLDFMGYLYVYHLKID